MLLPDLTGDTTSSDSASEVSTSDEGVLYITCGPRTKQRPAQKLDHAKLQLIWERYPPPLHHEATNAEAQRPVDITSVFEHPVPWPDLDNYDTLRTHTGLLAIGHPSYAHNKTIQRAYYELKRIIDMDFDLALDERVPTLLGIGPYQTVPALFWSSSDAFLQAANNLSTSPATAIIDGAQYLAIVNSTIALRTFLFGQGAFVGWLPLSFGVISKWHPDQLRSYCRKFARLGEDASFFWVQWSQDVLRY